VSIEHVDGKTVIVVYIPESPAHQKPVFIKSKGADKGSFRRIGPTDQLCTEDDLAIFYQARGHHSHDETAIDGTSLADVEPAALNSYREFRRKMQGDGGSELLQYSDEDLLYALNATTKNGSSTCLTLAGLVLFGRPASLRRHLPMTRVDYIRVDGREWVPDPDRRYQSIEKLGPLILTIPQLINQILDDLPKAFSLPEADVQRKEVPLIPRKVIREALVNALMHRSYRTFQPVQIIRYSNRIEIKNPGYSLIPDERLGEPGSRTRNPKIACTLHEVGLAETKGTGIRVMREAMATANLTPVLLESDRVRDEFTLRLLVHHLFSPEDIKWLARFKHCNLHDDDARALVVLREIGALDNATYRSVNRVDALTASGRLRKLRDLQILDQRGRGATTYYVPGGLFTAKDAGKYKKSGLPAQSLRGESDSQLREEMESLRRELPESLRAQVEAIGRRTPVDQLNEVILLLCNWKPLPLGQIAVVLNKNAEHLRSRNLKRLLAEGKLTYMYPEDCTF
jgi:ATP-dependent DNA helicase RecG